MASNQGNYDNSANVPLWVVGSVNKAPTAAEAAKLYGNTSPNVYFAGETVGVFAVDSNEADVNGHVTPGWVLRTEGSGGRAGRVTQETLSVLANVRSDNNSDDTTYADANIVITSQPAALSGPVSAASGTTITLTVGATIDKGALDAGLSYRWQVNNNTGGSWVDVDTGTGVTTGQPGNMIKTGADTATLVLDPTTTTANNFVFRAKVYNSAAGVTVYSANARILISA